MFHYFGNCQTDRGDALVGWQVECVLSSNLTTPVTIYSDESSTPILSVSGVANRAVTDTAGNFDFFVPDGTYGIRFYDGTAIYQRTQRYVPMYGAFSAGRPQLDSGLATATEAIASGSFVNLYNASGVLSVRKADATDPTKFANGFVLSAISNGASGAVMTFGLNSAVTVAAPAAEVWLSDTTPGTYTTTAPTTAGYLVQPLGPAVPGVGVFFIPQPRTLL